MTAEQVGRRIGCSKVTVVQMEKREGKGKVTLEVLERAARAMGCRLVYGIVPAEAGSLEEMVDAQALRCARRRTAKTAHSMQLEQLGVDEHETEAQVLELARSLKDKMRSSLWDEP